MRADKMSRWQRLGEQIYPDNERRPGLIPLPDRHEMSPEQQKVYDDVVNGPRGTLIGPLRAVIHSPELADRWQRFGEYVRYRTVIPHLLKELAILVCARRWNSELEWAIHGKIALEAGLPRSVLDDIANCRPVAFDDPAAVEVYNFAREMQIYGKVSDALYDAALARWGERGIVELTALVGYYSMVAMMLNTHQVPVPSDGSFPLLGETPATGLTDLPAATGPSDGTADEG
jgi:4-carboxymuconolactone decarboxylase